MKRTYYQDAYCYFIWKPTGIPSSFGKERCFLDEMQQEASPIVDSLIHFFGTDKKYGLQGKYGELGLLNRLDTDTSGLLYFAKNLRVYHQFRQMQAEFLLDKYYLAEVYGDMRVQQEKTSVYEITTPLGHHRYLKNRMVAIRTSGDKQKIKGKIHYLKTKIIEGEFLPQTNTSIVLVNIQKGLRHQIRTHFASIGHPICGDTLYVKAKSQPYDRLQLFSIGLQSV